MIGRHEVGTLGLGTAQFAFRDDMQPERSIAAISAAIDQGVKLIDTALAYSRRDEPAYAENLVRRALQRHRNQKDVFVATKGGHYRSGDAFPIDGRPEALRAHCESSLTALGTERIDLYQLHWVDRSIPLSESVGTLAELQGEGKINLLGLSNIDECHLEEARAVAPIATVQNRLSVDRPEGLPLAKLCASLGIVYLAYMPLGGSNKIPNHEENACVSVARKHGVSWQQVALAWLLLQPNVIPLVGSSRPETMRDSLQSQSLRLLTEDLALLPHH